MAISNVSVKALSDAIAAKAAAEPKGAGVAALAAEIRDCVEALTANKVVFNGWGFSVKKDGAYFRDGVSRSPSDLTGSPSPLELWLTGCFSPADLVAMRDALKTVLTEAAAQ